MVSTKLILEVLQDIWPFLAVMFSLGIWEILI